MNDLALRTRAFGVRICRLCDSLPHSRSANVIAYQLLRAGTSVGAQYHEGIRSRSDAELISKMESSLQELEEAAYWLALPVELQIVTARRLAALRKENGELTAIFVACVKKLKARRPR